MSAHLVEPRFFCQELSERRQTKYHRRPKPEFHSVDPATNFNAKRAERYHHAEHYLRSNIRWVECMLEQMREETSLAQTGNERSTTTKRTCHSEIAPVHLCRIE